MKFSIIVPVYNVEQFLSKCLDSVINQQFSDYEIVAVNDGSTDSSQKILEEYARKTKRLRIFNQENKGLGGARNTGIYEAVGDYLLLLDSDDYLEDNALEKIGEYLDRYNLDILAFDCNKVDMEGKLLEKVTVTEFEEIFTKLTQKQFVVFEPTACTKVYRRNLFIDNDINFPEKLWYEDLATIFKLVPFAKKIGYLKQAYYNYVQQPNSITHSVNTKRMMEIMDAVNIELDFYKNRGLFKEYYKELEWNCVLHALYYSSFRLLTCGYHVKEMEKLHRYCKSNFPNMEKNDYVLQRKGNKYLMDLVLKKRFLNFYVRTGFMIKCVKIIKSIVPLKKWRG